MFQGNTWSVSDSVAAANAANPFLSIFPGVSQFKFRKIRLKSSVDATVKIQRCAAVPAGGTDMVAFPHAARASALPAVGLPPTFSAKKDHSGAPGSPELGPFFALVAIEGMREFNLADMMSKGLPESGPPGDGYVFLVSTPATVTFCVEVEEL